MDNFFGNVGKSAMSFADRLADAVKSPDPATKAKGASGAAATPTTGRAGADRSTAGETETSKVPHPSTGRSRAMLVIQERDMLRDFVRS